MIVFFLRTLPIIASIILYPAYSLCKEPSVAPHSEAKLVNGKAKNTLNHTWVNREVGVLEEHEPILVPEDIPFMDENDQPHIFDEFYGQVLLVNFWATWCAPCTQEMPALSKLQRDFKRKNFKVLAISGDFKGVDAIREFYAAHEITNLPIYHDPKNVLSKTFGVNSFPTSLIIDAEGNEIARILGSYVDWDSDEFRQFITSHTDQKIYPVPSTTQIKATDIPPPVKEGTEPAKENSKKTDTPTDSKSEVNIITPEKLAEKPKEATKEIPDIPENAITVQGDALPPKPKKEVDLSSPEQRRRINLRNSTSEAKQVEGGH